MSFYKEIFYPEFVLVKEFFDSHEKARVWFDTENPLLGGRRPSHMLYPPVLRKKLVRFIENAIAENKL